jgi:hypothetical protein
MINYTLERTNGQWKILTPNSGSESLRKSTTGGSIQPGEEIDAMHLIRVMITMVSFKVFI